MLSAAADDLYSGKAGQNVTWNYAPDPHTLTFSGNGLMSSYCEFDSPTPRDTPWKVPDSVTVIGNDACTDCDGDGMLTLCDLSRMLTDLSREM